MTQEIRRIGPPLDDPEAWRTFTMDTAEKWWNACTGARRREVLRLTRMSYVLSVPDDSPLGDINAHIVQLYVDLPKGVQRRVQWYFESEVRTRCQ